MDQAGHSRLVNGHGTHDITPGATFSVVVALNRKLVNRKELA
jgi:hypothetical protein